MYFCYIDESGTPQIPGNTSHYILCGLSIPIKKWKQCEKQIFQIKKKYNLSDAEIHTGWLLRSYLEQTRIDNFESLPIKDRKDAVAKERVKIIYELKHSGNTKLLKQTKKNFRKTEQYTHLTFDQRQNFVREIADKIGTWSFARIFAEAVDKAHFNPSSKFTVDEMALEQIVSRFENYMSIIEKGQSPVYGALIHDNNVTVAKRHTELMQLFHRRGTLWTKINHIIETPLFVNSELTSMVQIADLCAYALRRFFELDETDLFDRIQSRFDKHKDKLVGIRHFTDDTCKCRVCEHRRMS